MTPSVTPGIVFSCANASGKAEIGIANLSRTSTAAVRWLRPKQKMLISDTLGCCQWSGCCRRLRRNLGRPRPTPSPITLRKQPQSNNDQLTGDKSHERTERLIHKAVGMQADAKHINSKPRQTNHDIAENAHHGQATLANQATPAGVQNCCVPQHN